MFKLSVNYISLALLLFLVEVLIGFYMHDAFIRPYGGDFFVVILIYCFVKGIADTPLKVTLIGVLLFAYLIEVLQYFRIVNVLGLQNSKIACTLIGTNFEWIDLLMYTLGILLVWFVELTIQHKAEKVK